MRRIAFALGTGFGAALVAAPALAQTACTRESLQESVDAYLAAQTAGDRFEMTLAHGFIYEEQDAPADIDTGILSQPLEIDFSRSLFDTEACRTFSEIIITDPAHPYVLGVALTLEDGVISEIGALVSDGDDWLFDADAVMEWAPGEDWGPIPEDRRDTRETLIAAANAYYDRFNDPAVTVPFGEECYRLEGGARTNSSPDAPANSCNLGMPPDGGMVLVDRSFVVDPVIGAVAAFDRFGGAEGEPDVHIFRLNEGRIRYVHAITVCPDGSCDFGQPPQPAAD